jgi:hypothetical protein
MQARVRETIGLPVVQNKDAQYFSECTKECMSSHSCDTLLTTYVSQEPLPPSLSLVDIAGQRCKSHLGVPAVLAALELIASGLPHKDRTPSMRYHAFPRPALLAPKFFLCMKSFRATQKMCSLLWNLLNPCS